MRAAPRAIDDMLDSIEDPIDAVWNFSTQSMGTEPPRTAPPRAPSQQQLQGTLSDDPCIDPIYPDA